MNALIHQGMEASGAGGLLLRFVSDPASGATLRAVATKALGGMRSTSAVPALLALFEDRSASLRARQAAARLLGEWAEQPEARLRLWLK